MCVVRLLIAVFTLCLVLAGCSKGGGGVTSSKLPTAILPASTSASASPSRTGPLTTGANVKPGETPPVADALAIAHSDQGALLSAVYFMRVIDWSLATMDSTLIGPLSLSSCKTCGGYVSKISEIDSEDGTLTGGRIDVVGAKVVTGTSNITADRVVELQVTQGDVVIGRPSVEPSTQHPTPASAIRVYVSWVNGAWKVVELGTTR